MRNSEYSPPQPHARARSRAKCKSAAREGLARKRLHLASENSGHGTCLRAGSLATLGAGAGIVLAPAMNTSVQCAACPTPQGGRHNSIPIILVRTALPPFSFGKCVQQVANWLWPEVDTANGLDGGWNDDGYLTTTTTRLVCVDPRPCYAGCSAVSGILTDERRHSRKLGSPYNWIRFERRGRRPVGGEP
jgi:hypothetical protein